MVLIYSFAGIKATPNPCTYAAYFISLGFPEEEASELHHKYYKQYGLALRGLVRHHQIGEWHTMVLLDGGLRTKMGVLSQMHWTSIASVMGRCR